MNYSSLEYMAGKKGDNAARVFGPHEISTDDVDAGWDIPKRSSSEGLDQFVYAPDSIRTGVAKSALEASNTDQDIDAEDCLKDPSQGLQDILKKEGITFSPSKIVGGISSEEIHSAITAGKMSVHLSSTPGEIPENNDAVLIHHDDQQSKTTFVISHGPQNDQLAATLANAAVLKAGYELAKGKHDPLYVRGGKMNMAIDAVKDEFDLSHKNVDFAIAELTKPEFSPSYDLEIVSKGPIHCYVINSDEHDVRTYDVENVHVERADLAQLFTKIETPEAMKEFVEQTEVDDDVKKILYRINVGLITDSKAFPGFREKVFLALVKQNLNDVASNGLDDYVAQRRSQGSTSDEIVDVVFDYINSPGRHQMKIEMGDTVILATDELVQSMGGGKRTGYDIPISSRMLLEIQSGTPLPVICEEIVQEFREKQRKEQIPESSSTLIAFQVPVPGATQKDSDEVMKEYFGPFPENIETS